MPGRVTVMVLAALVVAVSAAVTPELASSATPVLAHEWLPDANDNGGGGSDFQASMAYDIALGTAMYVGTYGFSTPSHPTPEYGASVLVSTGQGWSVVSSPSFGFACCFDVAYDPVAAVVVGVGSCPDSSDQCTWMWNGGPSWTEVASTGLPQLTDKAGLAYDAALGGMVLLGTTDHGATSRTFLWNGSGWRTLGGGPSLWPPCATPSQPCAPRGQALAYDAARSRLLFVGGTDGAQTWALRGTTWTQLRSGLLLGAGGPMAYDPLARQVVMVGSLLHQQPGLGMATFTWNGGWHEQTASVPTTQVWSIAAIAFDARRAAVIGMSSNPLGGLDPAGLDSTVVYSPLP